MRPFPASLVASIIGAGPSLALVSWLSIHRGLQVLEIIYRTWSVSLSRQGRGAAGLFLVGALSGCLGDAPVSPRDPNPAAVSTQTVSLPPSQSFFLPAPVEGQVTNYPTGITVPKGMSARMRVTGVMAAEWNPQCGTPPSGGGVRSYDVYFGGSNLGGNDVPGAGEIKWLLSSHPDFTMRFTAFENPPDSGVAVWSPDLSDAHGELIFRREPIGSGCLISGTAYATWFLSGGQTVQVDFATMDITASQTSVAPNQPVTFTATASNFVPADADAVGWVFVPDGSTSQVDWINVESCQGARTCVYAPAGSGRMIAVNENVVGYSPAITVDICPPTGDPVLDDPDVRRDLEAELIASRGNGGALAKQEHTGWIYQLPNTQDYLVHPEQDPGATDCGNTIHAPQGVPGWVPVRPYHTHPSYNGEKVFGCPQGPGVADRSPKWGGGSVADWKAAQTTAIYVVTYDRQGQPGKVYRLDPNLAGSKNLWGTNPNKWQFDSNRCVQKLP